VYADGKVLPGLVIRRNKEKDLFLDCRMAEIKDMLMQPNFNNSS
jgi:hypothetical protein